MTVHSFIFVSVTQQPNLGLGCLVFEVPRSHTVRHTCLVVHVEGIKVQMNE